MLSRFDFQPCGDVDNVGNRVPLDAEGRDEDKG